MLALLNKHKAKLGTNFDKWVAQYAVDKMAGNHQHTLGMGKKQTKRDTAPGSLTGPAAAAGTPAYEGGGNLEKGLDMLSDDAKLPAPPAPAPAPTPTP